MSSSLYADPNGNPLTLFIYLLLLFI